MTLEDRLIRILQTWRIEARDRRSAQNKRDSDGLDFAVNDAAALVYEKCAGDLAAALAARNSPPKSKTLARVEIDANEGKREK
jgi:hypothetical protein